VNLKVIVSVLVRTQYLSDLTREIEPEGAEVMVMFTSHIFMSSDQA
jgi:hypothetical protein